jgi:hypothetical protein
LQAPLAVQAVAPQGPPWTHSPRQQAPPRQTPEVQSADWVQAAPPVSSGSQLPLGPVQKKPLWQSALVWQSPRQAVPASLQT